MASDEAAGSPDDNASPRGLRLARFAGRGVLLVFVLLAMAEITLQIASLFMKDRVAVRSGLRSRRIACVGDSHTFGAGVPPRESYPSQLQAFLDARAPGEYTVVNLGVPGMNTAQVLGRLPQFVFLYKPEAVIVWVGINNAWNRADMDLRGSSWRVRLDGLLTRSRLYRFVRVRLHDRRLDREMTYLLAPTHLELKGGDIRDPSSTVVLSRGGRRETIRHRPGALRDNEGMSEGLRRDVEAMADYLGAAGIRLVLLTYPIDFGLPGTANGAIRRAAADRRIDWVDSGKSLARVPPAQRRFIWAAHPTGPIYREIARDVADLLLPAGTAGSAGAGASLPSRRRAPPAAAAPARASAAPPASAPR